MATGIPVIASNAPGMNSILTTPSACGRLVIEQFGQAFADAVAATLDQP